MQTNIKLNKSGVSLIAVLLFMMIATIAATATWKWISSEGFSSASRMLKREAYQSSMAGIENTRSWMTFHANDVGALIKQYIDGGNQPINLDAQLRPLQRAGQNYHVWLMGVNTENKTYKLKILSSGEARGGSKHSEVAIFNVDGLYRVSLPYQKAAKKTHFDYAYFGGTYNGAGDLSLTSAVVNGDWHGNPQSITTNFIVTGNAMLSGNTVDIGRLACVGGSMRPENNGLRGHSLFVNGDFMGNIQLTGDAYFNRDVSPSNAGEFSVAGNATLNGILTTVQKEKNLTLGSLCMAENAKIISQGKNYTFKVKGDVWMPGAQNLWYGSAKYSGCTCKKTWCSYMGHCTPATMVPCTKSEEKDEYQPFYGGGKATYTIQTCNDTTYVHGGDNYATYDKIILGENADSKLYMKSAYSWSQYNEHRNDTKVVEEKDKIARCNNKPGVVNPLNHAYCETGPEEKWKGLEYYPYPERASKDNLYCSFYYNGSGKEVDFRDVHDDYWLLCNKWNVSGIGPGRVQYCEDVTEGVTYGAYFVANERYWDGYDPEASHPHHRLNHTGTSPTGSPYCTDSKDKQGQKKYRVSCDVTPWFKSLSTSVSRNVSGTPQIPCADDIQTQCDQIWEKKPGCDGSSYKVDDILVTAKAKFEPYARKGCAATITRYDKNLVNKLNACYNENNNDATKRETNLYNGYLVVKVSGGTNSTNPTGTLNGKFIIIAQDALYTKLPPTGNNSFVFLYLEKGANTLNDVKVSNYFIYTEGDISNGNQFNLTGSIYATAESCAGIGKLQSSSVTYSAALVEELTNSGIICENDGGECGGDMSSIPSSTSSGGESSAYESSGTSGLDEYYVSMAPQLSVSLESQYKNKEPEPAAAAQSPLNPSFIVLPRVIYMPSDPYGTLSDYYSVLPLNGSTLKRTDVNVQSCLGNVSSIPTQGKLYNGSPLAKGIYKCEASAPSYDKVPFWVVVGNQARGSSPVVFERSWYEIAANDNNVGVGVNVVIPPHGSPYQLKVQCLDNPNGDQWSYTLTSLVQSTRDASGVCKFDIPANTASGMVLELFRVKTTNATSGSVNFSLISDENYQIGNPATTQVQVASSATLKREDVSPEDITEYCNAHPGDCPPEGERGNDKWPDCSTNDTWVEPSGASYSVTEKNEEWKIVVGSSGTLKLAPKNVGDCIAIIPDKGVDLATFSGNTEKKLPASLKARKRTLTVAFVGEMDGDHPVIDIAVTNHADQTCVYSSENHSCSVTAFNNELVSLFIDKDTYPNDNRDFSFWKCSGPSCPDQTGTITSVTYPPFKVQDDNTTVYAHFNENDKHCFFDEFKSGSVSCTEGDVYCIDRCGTDETSVCSGVDVSGVSSKSKWHLISGKWNDIDVTSSNIAVKRYTNKNSFEPVVVLSTVNAGVYGTLKALFQLPKETKSFKRNAMNVARSGFMLHSNATGSEYLMLNMFVNTSGYLEAQLCTSGGHCLNGLPELNSNPASVYASSMVMMAATLSTDNKLNVSAFTGNYYGNNPKEYQYSFDLNSLGTNYNDVAHEYVGFSLADPNFKLYGIGWKSDTYSAECHDTYPTVKCSFAAVATDGVIPTGTYVKPWVGHSGWFDSKTYSCTEKYYYYNGGDACGGASGLTPVECTSSGYSFAETAEMGAHGYTDNDGNDVKTAKARLSCSLNSEENAWSSTIEPAHCGPFWTGKLQECSDHVVISEPNSQILIAGETKTFTLTTPVNLRAASLSVVLENTSSSEIEIWLASSDDSWGSALHASKSVTMTSTHGTFDVNAEMVVGTEGFNPEKVSVIGFKNYSDQSVTITSVIASCKNAVDINSCSATYTSGKWEILVDVGNKDNVSSYTIDAKVDGLNEFTISGVEPTWDGEHAKFEKADNPYLNNQGKSYQFTATILNKTGTTASKVCSVNPTVIGAVSTSCSIVNGVTSVVQGEGLPTFSASFTNCPSGGCPYEIYLESYPVLSGTATEGNSTITKTAEGNTEDSYLSEGTYHYYLKNQAETQSPFPECSATFEITKASGPDVGLETGCGFRSSNIQPGANANFYAVNGSNVANKDYKLVYTVGTEEFSAKTANMGSNAEVSFDISGVATAKSRTFTLKVKDTDGTFKTSCSADLTVNSPNITCSKITESNVDKFKISVGRPCTNNACPWKLVKGDNTASPTSSSSDLNSSEYKIPFNGAGYYTLYVNDEAVSGCKIAYGPEVTCPTSKRTFVVNQQASLMMSGLKNCASGCDYDLVVNGTNEASNDNGNYKSASDAIYFTPTLELDDVDYTFTVYANGDHTLTDNCSGKMQFTATETCTDKGTWNITSNNGNAPGIPWAAGTCFKIDANRICTQLKIKSEDCKGKTARINGVNILIPSGNSLYDGAFPDAARSLTVKLEMPEACRVTQFFVDGCETISAPSSVPTISGCPSSAIVTWPNEYISLPMTLSNCKVIGGCTYTLSSSGMPDITGTTYGSGIPMLKASSSDKTTVSYTLSVKNNQGDAASSCEFSVTTDSDARLDKSITTDIVFGPGKYKLYCSGNSGTKTMQPSTPSGSECSTWFNPSITTFSGGPWGACNWQASVTFPIELDVPVGETIKLNCW